MKTSQSILNAGWTSCPICKKEFSYNNQWAYKRPGKGGFIYLCSWSCLNKYDDNGPKKMPTAVHREESPKAKAYHKSKRKLDYALVISDYKKGIEPIPLSKKYNVSVSSIRRIIHMWEDSRLEDVPYDR